eukprot:c17922_g1_i1.p1 GENE.c17922_g1_i1~~c17922_g1_i1.p1  ORF type:complete len:883 (-),score=160.39 c17922_g1_i1:58-2412(-)
MAELITFGSHTNDLSGTIPSEFGGLSSLRFLELSGNRLTGSIPSQLERSTLLNSLSLDSNQLTGVIPSQLGVVLTALLLHNNRLSGTIPSEVTGIIVISLSNNMLQGTIPPLGPHVFAFAVSSNRLTGSLPRSQFNGLRHFVAHNNRLEGSIPSQFGNCTKLESLLLFGNRLRGAVPPIYQTAQSMILLFDNSLSCDLPLETRGVGIGGPSAITLLALGNEFPQDTAGGVAAKWLYSWDSASTHLFIPLPRPWVRLSLTVLFGVVINFICVTASRWLAWGARRRRNNRPNLQQILMENNLMQRMQLWKRCLQVCGAITGLSLIYMLLLWASANAHTCGEILSQVTVAEMAQAGLGLCTGVGLCVVVHFLLCAWGLVFMSRTQRSSPSPEALSMLTAPIATESDAYDGICQGYEEHGGGFDKNEAVRAATESDPSWSRKKVLAVRIGLACFWSSAVLVLNVPTMLHASLNSMPTNNSLGLRGWELAMVSHGISPMLVLVSEVIIPQLTKWVVASYVKTMPIVATTISMQQPRLHQTNRREYVARQATFKLILAARILVLAVLPILFEIALVDGCFQGARKFWQPCMVEGQFDVEVDLFWVKLSILSHGDVCAVRFGDPSRCVRKVIKLAAALNLNKIVWQALLTVMQRVVVFGFGFHVGAASRVRLSSSEGSNPPRNLIARMAAWIVPKQVEVGGLDLAVLSWMTIGFALGGVAPLVWAAVLLALLSQFGSVWFLSQMESLYGAKILRNSKGAERVPVELAGIGLVIQFVLGIWFFASASPCSDA